MTPDSQEPFRRARMRSRRGLLELDLFLVPFVEAMYLRLSKGERQAYDELLQEEDTDILDWLKGARVDNASLIALVERIRHWHFEAPKRR